MTPRDEARRRLHEALTDPEVTLGPDVLDLATREERRQYDDQRLLDSRLRQAFGELAKPADNAAPEPDEFRRRLLAGIAAAQAAGPVRTNWGETFRRYFFDGAGTPYRWAPALILLLLLPALPMILELGRDQQEPQRTAGVAEDGRSREAPADRAKLESSVTPPPSGVARAKSQPSPKAKADRPEADSGPLLGEPPLEKRAEEKRSPDKEGATRQARGASRPSAPAPERSMPAREAESPSDEAALESALASAKTTEEKARILKKLEELHRRKGDVAKLKKAQERRRALGP